MRIELLSLTLTNFKGIQSFVLDLSGHDTIVSGANGTGKTSLFDAWLWLLCDMDSRGNKGAEAAKTTAGTDFVHFLTHEVRAIISVDGKHISLRKTLVENWVKPHGKDQQVFSGNNANFWVDDVPRQAKEYAVYISTLINPDYFKLLSDPLYFSESMKWSDRLNMLVEISGGISEEDVAAGDRDLESLLVKMGDKSFPDFKKMVQEQIRRLNNEIDSIPARIDEQKRSIPAVTDYSSVESELKSSESAMEILNAEEISVKEAMKPLLEMQDKVFRLRRDKDSMIDTVLKECNASRTAMSDKLQTLVSDQRRSQSELEEIKRSLGTNQNRVDALNKDIVDLRTKFTGVRAMIAELSSDEFIPPTLNEENCPTCGQKLPDDMLNEKSEKLRTIFESNKTENIAAYQRKLEQINLTGKENAARIKEYLAQNEADLKRIEEITIHTTATEAEIERLREATLNSPVMLPAQAEQDLRVQIIDQQILELNMKLAASSEDRSEELALSKKTIQAEIDRCKSILFAREVIAKSLLRITELEYELKSKAAMKTVLEGDIFQCERFVRARTEKLEGKINGMFTKVGFKLFTEQVNGGLSETCEVVVNNTTFSKANTAGQINAGMDIIRTVSRYLGIYVPVFVDHLESINDLQPLSSQVISLLVTRETQLQVAVLALPEVENQPSKQEVA